MKESVLFDIFRRFSCLSVLSFYIIPSFACIVLVLLISLVAFGLIYVIFGCLLIPFSTFYPLVVYRVDFFYVLLPVFITSTSLLYLTLFTLRFSCTSLPFLFCQFSFSSYFSLAFLPCQTNITFCIRLSVCFLLVRIDVPALPSSSYIVSSSFVCVPY